MTQKDVVATEPIAAHDLPRVERLEHAVRYLAGEAHRASQVDEILSAGGVNAAETDQGEPPREREI